MTQQQTLDECLIVVMHTSLAACLCYLGSLCTLPLRLLLPPVVVALFPAPP
jgi:hypothetical protein